MAGKKLAPLKALLKGLLTGYIITTVIFVIFALLMTYTDIGEEHIDTAIKAVTAGVCILSGFITARSAGKGGLLWGIISGALYVAVMCICAFVSIPDYSLSPKILISLALALAGGGLGGVVGVNMKK